MLYIYYILYILINYNYTELYWSFRDIRQLHMKYDIDNFTVLIRLVNVWNILLSVTLSYFPQVWNESE